MSGVSDYCRLLSVYKQLNFLKAVNTLLNNMQYYIENYVNWQFVVIFFVLFKVSHMYQKLISQY